MAINAYEVVFIAEPEIPTDKLDSFLSKLKDIITQHEGSVTSEDRWGKRRMAYAIEGHREGYYVLSLFKAAPTVVSAMEHQFNVTDWILRHLVIKHIPKKPRPPVVRREPSAAAAAGRPSSSGPSRGSREFTPRPPAAAPAAAPAAEAPKAAEGPSAS